MKPITVLGVSSDVAAAAAAACAAADVVSVAVVVVAVAVVAATMQTLYNKTRINQKTQAVVLTHRPTPGMQ